MKIALIGATGFVGSGLREEALSRKHEVTAIVRHPERLPVKAGLTAKKADVLDVDALAEILAGDTEMIAFLPTSLNAICCALCRAVVAMGMALTTLSG